jgi:hypothetical protein
VKVFLADASHIPPASFPGISALKSMLACPAVVLPQPGPHSYATHLLSADNGDRAFLISGNAVLLKVMTVQIVTYGHITNAPPLWSEKKEQHAC